MVQGDTAGDLLLLQLLVFEDKSTVSHDETELLKTSLPLLSLPWQLSRSGTQPLNCIRIFGTPWTVACQLLCPWNSPCKNIGVSCHFLLRGSSWPRDQIHISSVSCIAGGFSPTELPGKPRSLVTDESSLVALHLLYIALLFIQLLVLQDTKPPPRWGGQGISDCCFNHRCATPISPFLVTGNRTKIRLLFLLFYMLIKIYSKENIIVPR